jgi:hypothetical protein
MMWQLEHIRRKGGNYPLEFLSNHLFLSFARVCCQFEHMSVHGSAGSTCARQEMDSWSKDAKNVEFIFLVVETRDLVSFEEN